MHDERAQATPHLQPTPDANRYEAANLRRAGLEDVPALTALYREAREGQTETQESVAAWLGQGGCLILEDESGSLLCALRWREAPPGWEVDRVATLPGARGNNYGRWLMTKLEALAIRSNIPTLSLSLERPDADLLAYYQRMGYRVVEGGTSAQLTKKVGGIWQYQGRNA